MTPVRSPYSRVSRPSANVPACTSDPPASAACTTWSTRLSTTPSTRPWRLLRPHRGSLFWPTAGSGWSTTAAVSRWTCRRARGARPSRSCSPSCTRAATSAAVGGGTPYQVACTDSASRWSMPCPAPPSTSRCVATGATWRQSFDVGAPVADLAKGEATEETGTTHHLLGRRRHLRDHEVRLRDSGPTLPRNGVPEQRSDTHAFRRARPHAARRELTEGTSRTTQRRQLPLRRRNRGLRHLPQHQQRSREPHRHPLRG